MEYEKQAIYILRQFGINGMYKGCDYIVSGVSFIHENISSYIPITKILYPDIAKQYNTSASCVEKNIRWVIETIWKNENNSKIIDDIFDTCNSSRRPSNLQFLLSLYRHIESGEHLKQIYYLHKDNIVYTCPLTRERCKFCNDILLIVIHKIYK